MLRNKSELGLSIQLLEITDVRDVGAEKMYVRILFSI